jgi:protein involved in polysaccharide export with SLBB domain
MVPIVRLRKDTTNSTGISVQLFVTALLAVSATAQVAQPNTATDPRREADPTRVLTIPDGDPDYVIHPNDALSLAVQGIPFKLICFVLNDGTIAVPGAATKEKTEYVRAQGLTLAELQAVMTEKLKRPAVKVALYRHGGPITPPFLRR